MANQWEEHKQWKLWTEEEPENIKKEATCRLWRLEICQLNARYV